MEASILIKIADWGIFLGFASTIIGFIVALKQQPVAFLGYCSIEMVNRERARNIQKQKNIKIYISIGIVLTFLSALSAFLITSPHLLSIPLIMNKKSITYFMYYLLM